MKAITNIADLCERVAQGHLDFEQWGDVRAVYQDDLVLLNYTDGCGFKPPLEWNAFEKMCRGLILQLGSGKVVARPFDKFWNWGQVVPEPGDTVVEVTEKMDGSLGIAYYWGDRWQVATRGSFTSDQALWAQDVLNWGYGNVLPFLPYCQTLLFEIVYQGNRVVVNYGSKEGLFLLAARERMSGVEHTLGALLTDSIYHVFPRPAFEADDITHLLARADTLDANHEGWVVLFKSGLRLKIKGSAYRELARYISGFNFRAVLRTMEEGALDMMVSALPDHYLPLLNQYVAEIEEAVASTESRIKIEFALAPKDDRKTFALYVQAHYPLDSAYLFAMFDGKPLRPLVYKYAFRNRS